MAHDKDKRRGGRIARGETPRARDAPEPTKPAHAHSTENHLMSSRNHYPLRSTTRAQLANTRVVSDVNPQDNLSVTIYVRPTTADPAADQADPKDLETIEAWANGVGLRVEAASAARRSLLLSGTVQAASEAFGVELKVYEHPILGRYRGRVGPVKVPAELVDIVEGVFGLDNRRMGRSYLHRARRPIKPSQAALPQNVYVAPQVARLYNFPEGYDGSNQCIAILAFNGEIGNTGVQAPGGFDEAAIKKYFSALNLKEPNITQVVVHGPGNVPGDGKNPDDSTTEILLDIQVAGAIAPGAKLVIYFTEFTEQGWVDAISTIITDQENRPTILSCSYGNPEDAGNGSLWTKAAITKINECFYTAGKHGITICCASGDAGSSDEPGAYRAHADFPASSPWVIGCGGTRLESSNGSIVSETVWNDGPDSATGGGVSDLFPLPDYQGFVSTPRSVNPGHRIGRAVPDVAALADPETGLIIVGPGGDFEGPIGGTSAAAPLWAALFARIAQALGHPLGFINPALYRYCAGGVLRDVTMGNNGAYAAGPGYDACTGLGSPDGVKLLQALAVLSQTLCRTAMC